MAIKTPQFSPKSGVGTIWKDPETGKTWRYSSSGWSEAGDVGTGGIVEDVQKKGTFNIGTTPEENNLIGTLKKNGADDAEIQSVLKKRQEVLLTKKQDQGQGTEIINEPVGADELVKSTIGTKEFDPFKGKSKIEVLRDAFNNGVNSSKELEELGKTYDLLAVQTGADGEKVDTSIMSPAEKKVYLSQIKKEAITKMQTIPDASGRENALGALSTFDTGKDIISMLESGKIETGLAQGKIRTGIFGIGGRSLGKTTKEEDYFAALTETFAANYRKAMSGVSVNPAEFERLDKFLPSENKTKQANIEGILALSDYLANRTNIQLGMDVSSLKPEEEGDDPLNILGGGKNNLKNNPLAI